VSLATYSDLQTAVASELNRSDLTGFIPDFVTRFEVKARRALRDWLRSTVTATNVTADYLIPATVSDVLGANINDGTNGSHNYAIDLVSKEVYQSFMEPASTGSSTAGQLAYPDVDVSAGTTTLRFWPPATTSGPIANLKIEVILALPALSASQTTNALLRDAPDLYLFGSCAEAAKYLQHDERIQTWAADRDAGFKELRIQTERRLYGGAPRRIKLPIVFG
jgi:hypothetical protein